MKTSDLDQCDNQPLVAMQKTFYIHRMSVKLQNGHDRRVFVALAGVVAAIGALGIWGWSSSGVDMFVSLVEAGLAWCL